MTVAAWRPNWCEPVEATEAFAARKSKAHVELLYVAPEASTAPHCGAVLPQSVSGALAFSEGSSRCMIESLHATVSGSTVGGTGGRGGGLGGDGSVGGGDSGLGGTPTSCGNVAGQAEASPRYRTRITYGGSVMEYTWMSEMAPTNEAGW